MTDIKGISLKVFLDRYSLKNKKGESLEKTPEQMWKRIAAAIASNEKKQNQKKWEKEFYQAMEDFKYVPGGRILAGAGTGFAVTYYNCFVIPSPCDSRDGILDSLKQMVEIMARGGGVGINLSSLRPRGARVKKVNGFSSGPCNWAELFSVATKDIIQQGGTRRGALMLMLWDWHPDIEEFITVKQDLQRINGANLSVNVSDKFMDAVRKDLDWELVFPDPGEKDYDELWDGDLEAWKGLGKKVILHKKVKARKIWDLIADAAWRSAEPGVVFMERYNKLNNNWYWNRINCVNPCGEEGLPAWGVCNLGSINLSALVDSKDIDKVGTFNFDMLAKTVSTAVRFQDNIVDMDPYVFPGIRKTQLEGERRIGVGTMGLGDALIKLHLRYGSEGSLKFIEKVYKIIRDEAYKTSIVIAKEKGAFPKFDKRKYLKGKFIEKLPKELREEIKKYGVRNSIILMQAPTGSTSLMSNTTSGIEPVFEFEFIRRDRLGEHVMRHHLYDAWHQKHGSELKQGEKAPSYFVSANDLTPEDHVKVQAIIQKYVDASISKTVNAPKTHTVEDVKKLYTLAYELGCKGIAYMREGSRQAVLERIDTKKKEEAVNGEVLKKEEIKKPAIAKRPVVLQGVTYQTQTPLGDAFITINSDKNGDPFEAFVTIGRSGSDVAGMAEALGRMISLVLRMQNQNDQREKIRQIIAMLAGIGGGRSVGFGENKVRSLPDAVAKVLAEHFGFKVNGQVKDDKKKNIEVRLADGKTDLANGNSNGNGFAKDDTNSVKMALLEQLPLQAEGAATLFDLCPSCGGASLAHEEGCKKCYSCGYSEC